MRKSIFKVIKGKNVFIGHLSKSVREGGSARNLAFHNEFVRRDFDLITYNSMRLYYRLWAIFKNLNFLCFSNNKNIVFLQNTFITYIFPLPFFKYGLARRSIKKILEYCCNRNSVFIEINDLIYEQSIDLQLPINPNALLYQEVLFGINNLNYIFASYHMRDYIVKKYNISKFKTQVIINGAPELQRMHLPRIPDTLSTDVLKFVYVGTSEKGRGIEQLLRTFENIPHYLLLVGEGGEWIAEQHYKNVIYLGAHSEKEAANLISQCDMGIVHYDESKLYYNICQPTKYSFYLSAGLPILSTRLEESMLNFKNLSNEVCIFAKINDWEPIIKNLDSDKIKLFKENVNKIKNNFYWNNIFSTFVINE